MTLAELLSRRGLVLRADLLVPWARWITPEGEPRRFDARFFAAALPGRPAGDRARGRVRPRSRGCGRPTPSSPRGPGEMSVLPPTATTLHDFAVASSPQPRAPTRWPRFSAAPPVIEPVMPRLVLEDGQAWLHVPDEVGYPL